MLLQRNPFSPWLILSTENHGSFGCICHIIDMLRERERGKHLSIFRMATSLLFSGGGRRQQLASALYLQSVICALRERCSLPRIRAGASDRAPWWRWSENKPSERSWRGGWWVGGQSSLINKRPETSGRDGTACSCEMCRTRSDLAAMPMQPRESSELA